MSISDRLIETAGRYHREANKCRRARAYLSACIMQVSVLETALMTMCFLYSFQLRRTTVYTKEVPRQWIGALQDVPTEELSNLEMWPDGSAMELEARDIHISVHGLLTAILPAMLPSRTVAAIFASRGGQATSRAKRISSKVNGRKGGRPRKRTAADVT